MVFLSKLSPRNNPNCISMCLNLGGIISQITMYKNSINQRMFVFLTKIGIGLKRPKNHPSHDPKTVAGIGSLTVIRH